jgi:hypothetical protein
MPPATTLAKWPAAQPCAVHSLCGELNHAGRTVLR